MSNLRIIGPPAIPPGPAKPAVPKLIIPKPLEFEISQIAGMPDEEKIDSLDDRYIYSSHRTQEAIVQFLRTLNHEDLLRSPVGLTHVIKNYLDSYYGVMDRYRLQGELFWYLVRPIPWMPVMTGYEYHSESSLIGSPKYMKPSRILISYEGGAIQSFPSRSFTVPDKNLNDLYTWLEQLNSALISEGLYHRDIHGGNILMRYEPPETPGGDPVPVFSLIDWTWATRDKNAPHNGFIKGDDRQQIAGFMDYIDRYREDRA